MIRRSVPWCSPAPAAPSVRAVTWVGRRIRESRTPTLWNRRPMNCAVTAKPRACCTRCPSPPLAMINGVAAGAGLALALACDLRIASQRSRIDHRLRQRGIVRRSRGELLPDSPGRVRQGGRTAVPERENRCGRGAPPRPRQPGRSRPRALRESTLQLARQLAHGPGGRAAIHEAQSALRARRARSRRCWRAKHTGWRAAAAPRTSRRRRCVPARSDRCFQGLLMRPPDISNPAEFDDGSKRARIR